MGLRVLVLLCAAGMGRAGAGAAFSRIGCRAGTPCHSPGVPPCLMCSHGVSPAGIVLELCHSLPVVCLGRVRKSNLESTGGQGGREEGRKVFRELNGIFFPFSCNNKHFQALSLDEARLGRSELFRIPDITSGCPSSGNGAEELCVHKTPQSP